MIGKLAVALAIFAGTEAKAGCGNQSDACRMSDGEYHLSLPDGQSGQTPIVMFLHGAGSTGANVMRNNTLINSLLKRGYAVLAPTGALSFRSGPGRVWNSYPGSQGRNETEFLKRVVADASGNFDLDPHQVLLAGFSAGGFMVNYLACNAPNTFRAYAPVSGGFWRPHPVNCNGPVRLFHTHGWKDKTVPMEGRFLANGQYQQGDIFAGFEIWRTANKCSDQKPSSYSETGQFWRRKWSACAAESALEFALFPGGHKVPAGWGDMILDWFESIARD